MKYMERTNKIIIVPDVHGRTFWRELLTTDLNDYDKVIFLGDYGDPYGGEGITHDDCIKELTDIVQFKRNNTDKVILLLGNHDCSYLDGDMFAQCRYSYQMRHKYKDFFVKQRNLFQIAYEFKQGDINYLCTHAGVTNKWILNNQERAVNPPFGIKNLSASELSKEFEINPIFFAQIGRSRGGYYPSGSPVWADINDMIWQENPEHDYHQIFGHTMSKQPTFNKYWTMLDCQKIFVLENNELREYEKEPKECNFGNDCKSNDSKLCNS